MSILSTWEIELAEAMQHLGSIEKTESRQKPEPMKRCEPIQQSEAKQKCDPIELPARTTLLDLPVELLVHIFSYLLLHGKVYFALSTRCLYQIARVFEADNLLWFPRWSPKWHVDVYWSKKYHLRISFLIYLENIRWANCADCRKLHPREEFTKYGLTSIPSTKRSCEYQWARLVNICPCLTLTLRSRKQIMEYLMSDGWGRDINFVSRGLLEGLRNERDKAISLHKCKAYSTIMVDATFFLNDDNALVVNIRFEVTPRCPYSERTVSGMRICLL